MLIVNDQLALINLDFDNFSSVIKFNLLLWLTRSLKMFTTKKKIQKDKDAEPTEFEETVAQVSSLPLLSVFWIHILKELNMLKTKCSFPQALFDLENTNSELKSDLKDLFINSAVYVHNCIDVLQETFPSYSFNFLSSL